MLHVSAPCVLITGVLLVADPTFAQQRLPTIAREQYTAEQKKAAEEFLASRKVPVFGPFEPMMYSPEVMSIARSAGDYLRYHSALGNTLSELVILITAREWSQDYEWYVHKPIALKAGVSKDVADAIGDGRRPSGMSADEEIEGVAIRRCVQNSLGSDIGACAWSVFNDDLLTQLFRKCCLHEARLNVGCSSGAYPTRSRTGRDGYASAAAVLANIGGAAAPATRLRNCLR